MPCERTARGSQRACLRAPGGDGRTGPGGGDEGEPDGAGVRGEAAPGRGARRVKRRPPQIGTLPTLGAVLIGGQPPTGVLLPSATMRESESPPELNRPTGDGPLIRPPPTCDRSDRTYEQTRFMLPRAGLLVQVQLLVAFGWLVVTVKLFAVPFMVQVTPPEPT